MRPKVATPLGFYLYVGGVLLCTWIAVNGIAESMSCAPQQATAEMRELRERQRERDDRIIQQMNRCDELRRAFRNETHYSVSMAVSAMPASEQQRTISLWHEYQEYCP